MLLNWQFLVHAGEAGIDPATTPNNRMVFVGAGLIPAQKGIFSDSLLAACMGVMRVQRSRENGGFRRNSRLEVRRLSGSWQIPVKTLTMLNSSE
jgi:hypothetical protein